VTKLAVSGQLLVAALGQIPMAANKNKAMPGQIVGCIRVSTLDQKTDRQLDGHLDQTFTGRLSDKHSTRLNTAHDLNGQKTRLLTAPEGAARSLVYGRPSRCLREVDGLSAVRQPVPRYRVGGHGPELNVPLDERGHKFMSASYQAIANNVVRQMRTAGYGTPAAYSSGAVGTVTIDAFTNFTGEIHVKANDPNELARKLEKKKRLKRLVRPPRATAAS
jgi:hypothetical protein